jgi:hypothetical protein
MCLHATQEIAAFVLDLLDLGDRVGDLLTQQLAPPATQPMRGHFHRPLGHAQTLADCRQAGGAIPVKVSWRASNGAALPPWSISSCSRARTCSRSERAPGCGQHERPPRSGETGRVGSWQAFCHAMKDKGIPVRTLHNKQLGLSRPAAFMVHRDLVR